MLNNIAEKVVYDDGYFEYSIKPLGYALAIALIVVIFAIIATMITQKGKKAAFNTKQLVFCSLALSLGTVTSTMAVFELPAGGSVTLCSMLFISMIGYWYGAKIGILSAVAYGILQLIIKPYVIGLPQLFFDYILAFGALGFSGFFSNKKYGLLKGYTASILGRLLFATLSGVIFFASSAPEGQNVWIYSITYNASYIIPEAIATFIVIAIPAVNAAFNQVKKLTLE